MRTSDRLKLYELRYGKLIVDRRFFVKVYHQDSKLGMKLHKAIKKELKKKYATNATWYLW